MENNRTVIDTYLKEMYLISKKIVEGYENAEKTNEITTEDYDINFCEIPHEKLRELLIILGEKDIIENSECMFKYNEGGCIEKRWNHYGELIVTRRSITSVGHTSVVLMTAAHLNSVLNLFNVKTTPKELPDLSWMWHCSYDPQNISNYTASTDDVLLADSFDFVAATGFRFALRKLEDLNLIQMGDINRKYNDSDQYTWEKNIPNNID